MAEGLSPNLLEKERILRATLDAKVDRYSESLSTKANVEDLRNEIARLSADYEELRGRIRQTNPDYDSSFQFQPLDIRSLQEEVLDDQSLLLEYTLGEHNSYLWAVSKTRFSSYVLPKSSEIEKAVRRVRNLMTSRIPLPAEKPAEYLARVKTAEAQYWEEAAALSEMLLGPIGDQLGARRLLIVGEGILQYLPFAALPEPIAGAHTALVADREVISIPSASAMAAIRKTTRSRKPATQTLAVFADPVFQVNDPRVSPDSPTVIRTSSVDMSTLFRSAEPLTNPAEIARLPLTRKEAEAILSFVPQGSQMAAYDFEANRNTATSTEMSRYRIIHFATHGISNDQDPELSGLVLSLVTRDGKPQNGLLRLRDIYNLHLAAELVVLSACDTALGKEVKGEGLMSMVRGFMYSGTPRVLASLWKVDDEATAELMKEFYKHLLQEGMTPAAALRQAQITQMQKKSRQSPYYWAGFQLQGEWK
jgi:CHAT domain-containing protein